MKIGNYVRTKLRREFVIRKVIGLFKDDIVGDHLLKFDKSTKYNYYLEDEGKNYISSPNIIDLIEVGDYVNGEKVIRLFNPTFLSMGELPYVITDKNKYEPQEIENVVTKESFESMEYKLGD